jgi:hypothetical protein
MVEIPKDAIVDIIGLVGYVVLLIILVATIWRGLVWLMT